MADVYVAKQVGQYVVGRIVCAPCRNDVHTAGNEERYAHVGRQTFYGFVDEGDDVVLEP